MSQFLTSLCCHSNQAHLTKQNFYSILNQLFVRLNTMKFIFFSVLPAPSQVIWDREDEAREQKLRQRPVSALVKAVVSAPPYEQRKGWTPRTTEVRQIIFK